MSTTNTQPDIEHELGLAHGDSIDLAAMAALLADAMINRRRDEEGPDLSAVANLLAKRLAVHRDEIERIGSEMFRQRRTAA